MVEPGTFRTGLFRARSTSEETGPYAETVGPTRRMTESNDGTAPGDPDKAAAAILTALNAEHTPLRLPLGGDAVNAILSHADSMREEIGAWEKVARATDLDT